MYPFYLKIGNFSSKDFRNPIELLLFLVFTSKVEILFENKRDRKFYNVST